jgi:hypothetical protein
MSKGARIAARMVAGKPALRIKEDVAPAHGTFPLNLGDNEVRANGDVGDQDRWNNARVSSTQDKVNKIRARILQARAPGNQGAEQLPAVGSDNKPPPTSGQNNWPSLQLPDGMR